MRYPVEFHGNSLHQVHCLHVSSDLQSWIPSSQDIARHLSPEERVRYQRYLVQKKKTEFFLARKFIKGLVAGVLNIAATSIQLRPDDSGKPFLFVEGQEIPLYCNLSHTNGLIACVISNGGHTGIDVEFQEGLHDDLVQRFFHPHEIKAYMLLDNVARINRFYSLWTLKEAYVKAIGQGLYKDLNSFWFTLPDEGEEEVIELHLEQQRAQSSEPFRFFLSQPTTEHTLALAVQMEKGEIPEAFHYSLAADSSFIPVPSCP